MKFIKTYKEFLNEGVLFEEEKKNLQLDKEPDGKLKIYMSSKNDKWEDLFTGNKLQFGENAGNMYGFGIYGNIELPENADIGYKENTRRRIYGENVYELEIDDDKMFYFYYEYFKISKLWEELDEPSEQEFVEKQLRHFKIENYTDEDVKKFTPDLTLDDKGSEKNSMGQCAFNFYKFMSSNYYQRRDGTLKTPVSGFVYKGKNDGRTAVVWNPYDLVLLRKRVKNGEWEDLNVENNLPEESDKEIEDRVFDDNKTDEKKEAYEILTNYKGTFSPLGQFKDIVIHEDKSIDATFRSNVPAFDNGRHAYIANDNKVIHELYDKGFYLNKIDCWIKFGESDESDVDGMKMPGDIDKNLLPRIITGGFILYNVDFNIKEAIEDIVALKIKSNKNLVLDKCFVDFEPEELHIVEMNNCIIVDDLYDKIVKQGKHGTKTSIKESEEKEIQEYISKNDRMPKEDKESFAKKFDMQLEDFEKIYKYVRQKFLKK